MSVPLQTSPSPELRSPADFLAALFRSFVGYLILFCCFVLMLRRPAWQLSALDVVFAVVLLLLVALRWRQGQAGAARYTAALLGGAAVLWALANAVQLF